MKRLIVNSIVIAFILTFFNLNVFAMGTGMDGYFDHFSNYDISGKDNAIDNNVNTQVDIAFEGFGIDINDDIIITGYYFVGCEGDSIKFQDENLNTIHHETAKNGENQGLFSLTGVRRIIFPQTPGDFVKEFELYYDASPLGAVGLIENSKTDSSITVDWNNVVNAENYELYLDNVLIDTVDNTVNTYTFNSLNHDTTYEIKVIAKATSFMDSSAIVNITTDKKTFTNTFDFSFSADETTIDLSFASDPEIEQYEIYLNSVLVDTITDLNYQFTGLTPEQLYNVKVIAKASGYNDSSEEKAILTSALSPVTFNLINSNIFHDSIELNFNITLAETLKIYKDDVEIDTIPYTGETSYTFDSLEEKTDYTLKIECIATSRTSAIYENVFTTKELIFGSLNLVNVNRSNKLDENDTIEYTFTNNINTFTINDITNYDTHTIDGKKVIINLSNPDLSSVTVDFTVIDEFGQTKNVLNNFTTEKGGIWMTFDFSFVTSFVSDLVTALTSSSQTVLAAGLGLLGLIVGAFFLIGLGKKAVKKAK